VDAIRQTQESCTLRIITTNDVYELDNLPFLDGVIRSPMLAASSQFTFSNLKAAIMKIAMTKSTELEVVEK
jgi:hypothetical protein